MVLYLSEVALNAQKIPFYIKYAQVDMRTSRKMCTQFSVDASFATGRVLISVMHCRKSNLTAAILKRCMEIGIVFSTVHN
jgi:hypothetical protein